MIGALDLVLHRLRVEHGIPRFAVPLTRAIAQLTRAQFDRREQERVRAEAQAVRVRFAGRPLRLDVTRYPAGFAHEARRVPVAGEPVVGGIACEASQCSPASLAALAEHLRERGLPALRRLPIAKILGVLGAASERWLDPDYANRALAIEAIHRYTGFSREMVIRSIDLEMRSSRKLDLWRTLWTELGNPNVLDGQSWALTGEAPTVGFGPSLLAGVFSSNIPALPHLTYMRGLAVKAPVLGKVATHEPVFAGLYIDTLVELCPELAPALAAVWFAGGDEPLMRAMMARAEHVIAYGTDRALESLARSIPIDARRTFHGHRVGFGLIGRAELAARASGDLAERVARDFGTFDGQACLAPLVYFVETGSPAEAAQFAREVGRGLEALARWLPRRALTLDERAARRRTLEQWSMAALFGEGGELVRPADGAEWAVLVTEGAFTPQPTGDRLCHLHCVPRLDEAVRALEPYGRHLQNVALALADGEERRALVSALARLGASRVTQPGLMPTPSMMWHHDGRLCLADLVRWSDIA